MRDLLYYSNYIKLGKKCLLYKEYEHLEQGRVYLILIGRIILQKNEMGPLGLIAEQHSLGEESFMNR